MSCPVATWLRACSCRRSTADMLLIADQPSPSNMREQSRRDSDDGTSIAALHQSRPCSSAVSSAAAATSPNATPSAARSTTSAAAARPNPSHAVAGMPLAETSASSPSAASQPAPNAETGAVAMRIVQDDVAAAGGALGSATVVAAAAGLSTALGASPDHVAAAGARVRTQALPQQAAPAAPSYAGAELQPSVHAGILGDEAIAAADGCRNRLPPDVIADDSAGYLQPCFVRRPSACASEPDTTSVRRLAVG